jgi:hypothetical protein
MSEKSVNKRIRKLLEQDLAEAIAEVLRLEATGPATEAQSEMLQKVAERRAQTLGRFEASVHRGPPPPTPAPGPAKWGSG